MSSRPKILVVDDVRENLVAMRAILQRDDADVITAASARAAMDLLLEHEVAVALIDVQMPEIDGYELAELLRGMERTRSIPLIFVTAGPDDPRSKFRGYESGAVDFLFKPIDEHVLRSKVGVFLELHRQKALLASQIEELRRAQQQLLEADRRKDEFLAVLSHELRNPLTPIRNALFILNRAEPGSAASQNARDAIGRQVAHLVRLVEDLLDVTRIARGKVHLRRERLDLVESVRRVLDDHRAVFEKAGTALEVRLPAEPIWLSADPTRIAQIVGNLLGNAAKYTPRGGHVAIEVSRDAGSAGVVVRDDGVGMSAEMLPRLFEPFAQADRSLDRSQGGLGLGLALVKGMVELHGGTVTARSDGPGRGAEFRVVLPAGGAGAEGGAEAPGARSDGAPVARRVLVVEDNRDSADTLADVLRLMGHEVSLARDGQEALEVARRVRPEVVLCDLGLPGMNGFEVAAALRADPAVQPVRLVAVSGYASPEDYRRALAAGFVALVPKPPRIEAIEDVLAAGGRGDAGAGDA